MKWIYKFLLRQKNAKILSFLIIFPCILAYDIKIYLTGNLVYYGDAAYYWESGRSFSFVNYTGASFRGYFFSMINYVLIWISQILHLNEQLLFLILWALGFCFLISWLLPSMHELYFNNKPKLYQILILFGLIAYFWRGYFLYPLSDFLSLTLLLISIYLFSNGMKKQKIIYYIYSGLVLGCAMNVRPNYHYLFYAIILALMFFIINRLLKKRFLKSDFQLRSLFLVSISALVPAIPQAFINLHSFQNFSFFPLDAVQGGMPGQMLTFAHLQLGIGFQKFLPGLYPDWHAINLMLHEKGRAVPSLQPTADYYALWEEYPIHSFKTYASLIFKYPLDFAVIYFRHFFNALDLKVHSVYYLPKATNGILFSLLNYTVYFIAITMIYKNARLIITNWKISIPLFALLLPACIHIPGGIECRYFLAVYIVVYYIISFILPSIFKSRQEFFHLLKKYGFAYCFFLLVWFTMSSANLGEISPWW